MHSSSTSARLILIALLAVAGCGRLRFEDLGAQDKPSGARDADAEVELDAGMELEDDAGPVCEAIGPETCNQRDDDCNGRIDDIDLGGDGVTDCLRTLGWRAPTACCSFSASPT